MSRIVNVARMQLINKWTFLGIPMVILVASTALHHCHLGHDAQGAGERSWSRDPARPSCGISWRSGSSR